MPDSTQKAQSKLDFGGQDMAKKEKKKNKKKMDSLDNLESIEGDSGDKNALKDQVEDIGHSRVDHPSTTPPPPVPDHAGDVKEKKQKRKKAGKALTDVSPPDMPGDLHPKETNETSKEQKAKSAEVTQAVTPSDSALVSEPTVKAKKTKATNKVCFS
jgi:hypothetical protein